MVYVPKGIFIYVTCYFRPLSLGCRSMASSKHAYSQCNVIWAVYMTLFVAIASFS